MLQIESNVNDITNHFAAIELNRNKRQQQFEYNYDAQHSDHKLMFIINFWC